MDTALGLQSSLPPGFFGAAALLSPIGIPVRPGTLSGLRVHAQVAQITVGADANYEVYVQPSGVGAFLPTGIVATMAGTLGPAPGNASDLVNTFAVGEGDVVAILVDNVGLLAATAAVNVTASVELL